MDGKCYCCDSCIQLEAFEIGHVKSLADGGSNDTSNLRPICIACNRSMGKRHMKDFMTEYYPSLIGKKEL